MLADVPGSLFGALALASMGKIADGKTALNTMLFVMTLSMAMAGLTTHAYSNGMMDGNSWQVFVGAGIYGAYTLDNPAPFDRLVSVSDIEGATCTFLVFTADLFGYVATVVLMLWKTFSESGQVQSDEIVQQFVNALSIVVCIVVVCKNGQTACQACETGFANDQEEANLCYSCSSGMYSSLYNQTSLSRFWSSRSDVGHRRWPGFRRHGATHRVSQNLSCRFLSWSRRR